MARLVFKKNKYYKNNGNIITSQNIDKQKKENVCKP